MPKGLNKNQKRAPRPYVKSSFKLDNHVLENSGANSEQFLSILSSYMSNEGFCRRFSKGRRSRLLEGKVTPAGEGMSGLNNQDRGGVSKPDIGLQSSPIEIGLKSVLKILNSCATDSNIVDAICIDPELMKPTAVSHMMALVALSNPSRFYVIPGLSFILSQSLNMKRVSIIAIRKNCDEQIRNFLQNLYPIGFSRNKTSKEISSFDVPQFYVPIGKKKSTHKTK